RRLIEPEYAGSQPPAGAAGVRGRGNDIPALDKNVSIEGDADRSAGACALRRIQTDRGRPGFDRFDDRDFCARHKSDFVIDADPAAFDPPGDDAAVVEFVDGLNGQSEGQILRMNCWR